VPVLDSPLTLLLVTGCGFLVGGMAGMLGVGGSFLLVPLLHVLLDVPVKTAVGSTACQMLGPATAAILARKISRDQLRLPLILTGGLITGVLLGTMLLQASSDLGTVTVGGRTVPASELLVMTLYLLLLGGLGLFALYEVRQQKRGRTIPRGLLNRLRIPPLDTFDEREGAQLSIPVLSLFGLVTGIIGGLLGISGAMIMIPGLVYLLGIRSRKAILVSLVVVWITSFYATLLHAWHGNVHLPLAVALMFGGTVGARLGSDLSLKLQGPSLRRSIGWLALAAAALVAFRLVQMLSGGTG